MSGREKRHEFSFYTRHRLKVIVIDLAIKDGLKVNAIFVKRHGYRSEPFRYLAKQSLLKRHQHGLFTTVHIFHGLAGTMWAPSLE
jgi:hypothetical protein